MIEGVGVVVIGWFVCGELGWPTRPADCQGEWVRDTWSPAEAPCDDGERGWSM